jgi:hypothetical protein
LGKRRIDLSRQLRNSAGPDEHGIVAHLNQMFIGNPLPTPWRVLYRQPAMLFCILGSQPHSANGSCLAQIGRSKSDAERRMMADSVSPTKDAEADIREDWDELANGHSGRTLAGRHDVRVMNAGEEGANLSEQERWNRVWPAPGRRSE